MGQSVASLQYGCGRLEYTPSDPEIMGQAAAPSIQEAPPIPPVSSPQGVEGNGSEVPYPLHVAAGMDSAPVLLPQADDSCHVQSSL